MLSFHCQIVLLRSALLQKFLPSTQLLTSFPDHKRVTLWRNNHARQLGRK